MRSHGWHGPATSSSGAAHADARAEHQPVEVEPAHRDLLTDRAGREPELVEHLLLTSSTWRRLFGFAWRSPWSPDSSTAFTRSTASSGARRLCERWSATTVAGMARI
jgi:hypothetical protein